MELFRNLMYILVTSVLVENVVLAKFLGCCPFLGVSKKLDSAVGMSSAVIFVMLMATAVTWPIYTYLLAPNGLEYLQTIVFILVIAALVQMVEFILKKYMKSLYKALGVYLPLITTNCAVLDVLCSTLKITTISWSLWSMHWEAVLALCWQWFSLQVLEARWKA